MQPGSARDWRDLRSGGNGRPRLRMALSLLAFATAAAAFVVLAESWTDVRRPPRPPTSPGPFGPSLALSSTRTERTTTSHVAIHGVVRNLGSAPVHRTLALVTWRDKDGQIITSDEALIDPDPMLAGQPSAFTVVSTWNQEMANYAVRFTTLRGDGPVRSGRPSHAGRRAMTLPAAARADKPWYG